MIEILTQLTFHSDLPCAPSYQPVFAHSISAGLCPDGRGGALQRRQCLQHQRGHQRHDQWRGPEDWSGVSFTRQGFSLTSCHATVLYRASIGTDKASELLLFFLYILSSSRLLSSFLLFFLTPHLRFFFLIPFYQFFT